MPTVLCFGPYRFFFYATNRDEPLHIHVERDDKVAKFWLDPVRMHSSIGFNPREIRRIQKIVIEHRATLMEEWHAYFGS